MGHCFCDTILDFCDPDQTKVLQTYRELKEMYPADPSAPTITQTPVFGGERCELLVHLPTEHTY